MSKVLRFGSWLLPLALCLASAFLPPTAAAVTHNLTYAAALGEFTSGDAVTNANVSGETALTVTLYGSETDTEALWSRRMNVCVEQGLFAVELTDDAGTADGTPPTKYAKLNLLLDALGPTDELWVAISNVTVNARTVWAGNLARGRIGGVPFAVCADRAAGACGNFRVNGDLVATRLTVRGGATVKANAAFGGQTIFRNDLTFGSGGLGVSGLLAKPTIAGLATLEATTLDVFGTMTVSDAAVTNGTGCTLTATDASVPRSVAVTDNLSAAGGLAVGELRATTLTVGGTLSLEYGGPLASLASLRVPGGVYDTAVMPQYLYSRTSYTPAATAKNALVTMTVAAGGTSRITADANDTWCDLRSTGPQIVTTALVPVPGGGSCCARQGAVTASRKELE